MPRAHIVSPGPDGRILDALKPNALALLHKRVVAFQQKNFPGQSLAAKFNHLNREIEELVKSPTDKLEWADVLILFLASAWLVNIWSPELLAAAHAQMSILDSESSAGLNTMRPNALGVLQHRVVNFHRRQFAGMTPDEALTKVTNRFLLLKEDPQQLQRWADFLIVYVGAAHLIGLCGLELIANAEEKMDINDKRQWGQPDAEGCIHHVEAAQ